MPPPPGDADEEDDTDPLREFTLLDGLDAFFGDSAVYPLELGRMTDSGRCLPTAIDALAHPPLDPDTPLRIGECDLTLIWPIRPPSPEVLTMLFPTSESSRLQICSSLCGQLSS